MKISKDEQNKKHTRFSNSIRSICLTLCLTLIIGISPIYANTVNISVPDNLFSYIVTSGGTVDFTSSDAQGISATSKLTWYFGRLSQTIARIGSFTYQNGTYLATMYTYFSSSLNDIRTYSQNTAAATNASLTFLGSIENSLLNLNWKNRSLTASYYNTLEDAVAGTNPAANGSRTKLFVKLVFDDYYPYNDALFIEFPIFPYGPLSFSNHEIYIDKAYCPNNNQTGATLLSDQDMYFYYDDFTTCSSAYIDGLGRTNNSGFYDITRRTLILEITASQYFYCVVTTPSVVKSLDFLSQDYITFMNYMRLEDMNYNLADLSTDDVVDAIDNLDVDVNINDSINVTPINLDVQIGINDFTEVNTISNKLRTWLSTGVGVSALIGALDQLDDSFFTLYNRNIIETINSGYTDFYD